MGFFKDVVDMPNQYEYSKLFFQRFYRPEYATIVVVGDVKQEEVNRLAQKYFGNWKRGSYQPKIPVEPKQKETRYAHVQQAGFPPTLMLAYKGPAYSDKSKELPALNLLSDLLFGETSDLYKKLVLQERRVRSIGGGAQLARDPNLISVSASVVKAEDLQYVKDEITKALNEAKTKPVDPQRLKDTKSNNRYSFAMAMDSPDAIANALSQQIWLTGDPESLNRMYALYDQVTPQDLMDVAKKYFVESGLTIATISPNEKGGVN
ncbi:M16 family metallopeptidase [Rufibacter psychrotolerans]|uniref:M16 family metallopeptidase n=1 Tax=Rufibacter psychrotolerans TaxID=2812556 RepID=UPI0035B5267B